MRKGLAGTLLALSMLLGLAGPADAGLFGSDTVRIAVRVTDPAGHPVPYATIWGYTDPSGFNSPTFRDPNRPNRDWPQLNFDDLWRLTLRYQGSFELAQKFNKPVQGITIFAMTDAAGTATIALDARDSFGELSPAQPLVVGLSIMRRGFEPNRSLLHGQGPNASMKTAITLQPLPGRPSPADEPAYMKSYDAVRLELMDWQRSEGMSGPNAKRLEERRAQMEQAAEAAIAAGDKPTAALIYARIETMPEIRTIDGKIIEFAQTDTESPRNRGAIKRAIELDPDSDYFAIRANSEIGREIKSRYHGPLTEAQAADFRLYVEQKVSVFSEHARGAWMFNRLTLFYDYERLGQYDDAYQELQQLKAFEPRGADYADMLDSLKIGMRMHDVPVPADWK